MDEKMAEMVEDSWCVPEITENSADAELMGCFHALNETGSGMAIGEDNETPTEAVVATEGWQVLRNLRTGTNAPGSPVLARDSKGGLWVVVDVYGPWAIQVNQE